MEPEPEPEPEPLSLFIEPELPLVPESWLPDPVELDMFPEDDPEDESLDDPVDNAPVARLSRSTSPGEPDDAVPGVPAPDVVGRSPSTPWVVSTPRESLLPMPPALLAPLLDAPLLSCVPLAPLLDVPLLSCMLLVPLLDAPLLLPVSELLPAAKAAPDAASSIAIKRPDVFPCMTMLLEVMSQKTGRAMTTAKPSFHGRQIPCQREAGGKEQERSRREEAEGKGCAAAPAVRRPR
ncbi:MAG: hypothetical protein ACTHL1_01075 [Burkholderiaceae bacterium]